MVHRKESQKHIVRTWRVGCQAATQRISGEEEPKTLEQEQEVIWVDQCGVSSAIIQLVRYPTVIETSMCL